MKKSLIITLLFSMCFVNVFAQENPKPIYIRKGLSTAYFQGTHQVSMKQLVEICKPNPEAYASIKKARVNNDAAMVFGAIGGLLVGWPLGQALAGGEPEWAIAGVGAGFIGVSIPFSIKCKKYAAKAINTYNKSLPVEPENYLSFNFHLSGNGAGLRVSF